MITFKCGEILRLPVKRKQDRIYITPDLARKTKLRDLDNGYFLSTVTGVLRVKDKENFLAPCRRSERETNFYHLRNVLPPSQEDILQNVTYEYGSCDIDTLVKMLKREDFSDYIYMRQFGSSIILKMVNEKITIILRDNDTQLLYSGKQSTRLKLRDLLLNCLQNF